MDKINGQKIAEIIYTRINSNIKRGLKLVIVMVGNSPATESFIAQKRKAAFRAGVDFEILRLPADTSTNEIENIVQQASKDPSITAIVVQLPLPEQIDRERVLRAIAPEKDADSLSGGRLLAPSVGTVMEIINFLGKDIESLNFAVIGYGQLVGKPIYEFLLKKAKSVSLLRRGDNLVEGIKEADVIVTGTGSPGLIKAHMVREEAIIIDFGYGLASDEKIRGDFDSEGLTKQIYYTPTPGGTGPILVAKLFENIYDLDSGFPLSRE